MSAALGYSLALLLAGLVLLWLEVLVVSFGLLGLAATACLVGAVYFGFEVSPAYGWLLAALAPVSAIVVLVQGVRQVSRSRLVMRGEMAADAGYHHAAEQLGVQVGSVGVMLTPGMPSGRARFANDADVNGLVAECDVRAQAGSLGLGDTIRVTRIEGATVSVVPVPAD